MSFLRVSSCSSWTNAFGEPLRTRAIYQHGNILIDAGRLRMGGESLPLANIQGASLVRMGRPRRYRATVLIVAAVVMLAGTHLSGTSWGSGLVVAGALVGLWAWFFHRQRVWVVRLHLLLNQRLQILFDSPDDAEGFLTALTEAKGGELPVRRSA